MKYLWLFMFVTVLLGCSEIVPGTCYENPAGGAGGADSLAVGAGVGATTSGDYAEPPKGPLDGDGVGGFGDVPPRQPQDATNPPPECNIATQSPCNEKCLADYESAAIVCGKIENEAQRKTCQDSAHASYKGCQGNCAQGDDCLERCREQCEKAWERCRDHCPRGDKNCLNECSQELGRCLKECDRRCK
jgi:hypothetical protein